MKWGVIVNALSVLIGGIIGSLLGKNMHKELKQHLPSVFGISAMVIGISKINEFKSLTAVILSLILGYVIGELIDIQSYVDNACLWMLNKLKIKSLDNSILSIALATFCFSGTSFFGVLNEALANDSSILFSKSVLDFFTSVIFASIAGISISLVAVFQLISFGIIYLISFLVGDVVVKYAFGNFMSVGGVLTMTIALKLLNVIKLKPINVLPAFILVVIFSVIGI